MSTYLEHGVNCRDSLVKTLKAQSLPVLPKLMFSLLKFINEGNHDIAEKHSTKRKQA